MLWTFVKMKIVLITWHDQIRAFTSQKVRILHLTCMQMYVVHVPQSLDYTYRPMDVWFTSHKVRIILIGQWLWCSHPTKSGLCLSANGYVVHVPQSQDYAYRPMVMWFTSHKSQDYTYRPMVMWFTSNKVWKLPVCFWANGYVVHVPTQSRNCLFVCRPMVMWFTSHKVWKLPVCFWANGYVVHVPQSQDYTYRPMVMWFTSHKVWILFLYASVNGYKQSVSICVMYTSCICPSTSLF